MRFHPYQKNTTKPTQKQTCKDIIISPISHRGDWGERSGAVCRGCMTSKWAAGIRSSWLQIEQRNMDYGLCFTFAFPPKENGLYFDMNENLKLKKIKAYEIMKTYFLWDNWWLKWNYIQAIVLHRCVYCKAYHIWFHLGEKLLIQHGLWVHYISNNKRIHSQAC